jgi:hypothetical protein
MGTASGVEDFRMRKKTRRRHPNTGDPNGDDDGGVREHALVTLTRPVPRKSREGVAGTGLAFL